MTFRELRADEIEIRVGTVGQAGATLLLYKDARADMTILDEAGVKWKRWHEVINGNLFCTVSIWDSEINEWISRQDVGTESMTEKEKGQASDSFKRACTNWGIGRELYSSPFIHIKAATEKKGDRFYLLDKYGLSGAYVKSINYKDRKIIGLEIADKAGHPIFKIGTAPELISKDEVDILVAFDLDTNQAKAILSKYGYASSREIRKADLNKIMADFEKAAE